MSHSKLAETDLNVWNLADVFIQSDRKSLLMNALLLIVTSLHLTDCNTAYKHGCPGIPATSFPHSHSPSIRFCSPVFNSYILSFMKYMFISLVPKAWAGNQLMSLLLPIPDKMGGFQSGRASGIKHVLDVYLGFDWLYFLLLTCFLSILFGTS